MCTLLFLDIGATGLDSRKDRIVQLSMRLVLPTGSEDYNQMVCPQNFDTPPMATSMHGVADQVASMHSTSITHVLEDLSTQIEQADIIVGHNVESDIAIIIAEAKRNENHDLVATLTHPQFGLDAGRRAAICTQRLAADYLRGIGKNPSLSTTKLSAIYRQIFGDDLSGAHDAMVDVIACQRVYTFLNDFQVKHSLQFSSDIVCLED